MTLRNWLLGSVTLLVAVAYLAYPFIPTSAAPFDTDPLYEQGAFRIKPSSFGFPLPPGLRDGDLVRVRDMDLSSRLTFSVGSNGNLPIGQVLDIPVSRDGQVQHVQVQTQHLPLDGAIFWPFILQYGLLGLIAALGLLLLWRGNGLAAAGVALWCFSELASGIVSELPIPLPYSGWINWGVSLAEIVGTLVGLYLIADGLTREALEPEIRRRWRRRFIASLLVYFSTVVGYNGYGLATSYTNLLILYSIIWLHIWNFIVPLIVMLMGYRRAADLNRARIRWILFSLLGLLLSYMGSFFIFKIDLPAVLANAILTVLTAAAFAGFAYAVLRHRLVSLQLVLNRALVYGLITSLVVGVFAALLAFLERSTVNSQTNQFLALLIPLLLGMGINTIKRKVDEYINTSFFRHRHKAIAALTQFARSAAYVDDQEKLLDLAADELYRNSRAQGLAIYLGKKGKAGPSLARHQGPLPFTPQIGNDDLALLRLKAGDTEVDLHGTFTALGSEGYAYALVVRGELLGFIIMGPRPAEAYTQEERRLYAQVAQQVAVALHTLRLHEQQKLLQAIAKGSYKSLPKARAKAKELIEATG